MIQMPMYTESLTLPKPLDGRIFPLPNLDADPDIAEEDGGEGKDKLGNVGESSVDNPVLRHKPGLLTDRHPVHLSHPH